MDYAAVAQGLLIPFLGTALGASLVFFLRRDMPLRLSKALVGFAAGVMVAASFWGLLQPALEEAADMGMGTLSFVPAVVGFLAGMGFLLVIDVFSAGEMPIPGVSGKTVVNSVKRAGGCKHVAYVPNVRTLVDLLVDTCKPGDMLITQGAGDITQIGPRFIEAKQQAGE